MIKLEKEDLQVLERASNIIKELSRTCTEEERFNMYMLMLDIEGVVIRNLNSKEKGGE